jgi:hypothetical protein
MTDIKNHGKREFSETNGPVTILLQMQLVFDPKSGKVFEMTDECIRERVLVEPAYWDVFDDFEAYERDIVVHRPLTKEAYERLDWTKLTFVQILHTLQPDTVWSRSQEESTCAINFGNNVPAALMLYDKTYLVKWAVQVIERRRVRHLRYRTRITLQLAKGLHPRLGNESPLNVLNDDLVFVISRFLAC